MSKNCKKNMIYVYLIPKYDVLENEEENTVTRTRIED